MLSALKNFGIAFAVAAVVFGVISSFATSYLVGVVEDVFARDTHEDFFSHTSTNVPKTDDTRTPGTASPTTVDDIKGESFNLLLVVTDDTKTGAEYPSDSAELDQLVKNGDIDPDKLGSLDFDFHYTTPLSIVLVRANKSGKIYNFTPMSTIMRVFSPSGDISLADYYARYGINGVVSKIPALTGVYVDKYVLIGLSSLAETVDEFGEITFNVPTDIYYDGNTYGSSDLLKEYENLTAKEKKSAEKPELVIESGVQTITGKDFAKLVQFKETSSATVASKASITVGCAKAYLSLVADTETEKLLEIFQKFSDNEWIESSLSKEWIDLNSGVIAAYRDFDRATQAYPSFFKSQTNDFGTTAFVIPNIAGAVAAFAD